MPGSKLIAEVIELQNQMELPIGLVIKESRGKLPATHLAYPVKALRQMRIAKYTLSLLLKREQRLRKKPRPQRNLPSELKMSPNPDLQVY